jgi:hypothetical protein
MDIKFSLHMDFHANLNLKIFHLHDPKNVFQQKSFPQIPARNDKSIAITTL